MQHFFVRRLEIRILIVFARSEDFSKEGVIKSSSNDTENSDTQGNDSWIWPDIIEEKHHVAALSTDDLEGEHQDQDRKNDWGGKVKSFHRNGVYLELF